jgi:hypothetical protein
MRQVSYRDEQADEAVERIVRLDHRAVSHPAIRRWLVSKGHTLDSLIEELDRGGGYSSKTRRFTRSKLHLLLKDRSYLGEIPYKGQWYPGKQESIGCSGYWAVRFTGRTN